MVKKNGTGSITGENEEMSLFELQNVDVDNMNNEASLQLIVILNFKN
jgi:hypothetical protein